MPSRIAPLLVVLLALVAGSASAKICKVVAPDGSVTFTDRASAECPSGKQVQATSAAMVSTVPMPASTPQKGATSVEGVKSTLPSPQGMLTNAPR